MVRAYFIVAKDGISEEDWVVHSDLLEEDLGEMVGNTFYYFPYVYALLTAYYKYTVQYNLILSPPILLQEPLDIEGRNIHRNVVISRSNLIDGYKTHDTNSCKNKKNKGTVPTRLRRFR